MEPSDASELADTGPEFVFVAHSAYRPADPWVALMEALPNHDPQVSRAERLSLRDVIVDAIDELSDEQRWIFDAIYVRKMSLRNLAAEISKPKTTIAAWRDRLLAQLREKLVNDPNISDYLEGK